MKKLMLFVAAGLFSLQTFAAQGVFVGLNTTEYDGDDTSYDAEMGFEVGYTHHFDMGWPVNIRTGAGYVQKKSSVEFGGSTYDFEGAYLEIPVTAAYGFNEMFTGFAGLNFDILLSDDCEVSGGSCEITDAEDLVYNLVLGGHFNITEMHAAEVFYEMGMSEIAEDTEIGSSLGARYIYKF